MDRPATAKDRWGSLRHMSELRRGDMSTEGVIQGGHAGTITGSQMMSPHASPQRWAVSLKASIAAVSLRRLSALAA